MKSSPRLDEHLVRQNNEYDWKRKKRFFKENDKGYEGKIQKSNYVAR